MMNAIVVEVWWISLVLFCVCVRDALPCDLLVVVVIELNSTGRDVTVAAHSAKAARNPI
jgi:hypothetical protein